MNFRKICLYFMLFLVVLFPYLIVLALLCLFSNNIIKNIFDNNGLYLLFVLIIFYVFALISTIIVFITNIVLKRSSINILKINMIIKLVHIPAYILIFIAGLFGLMTIFTMGISIVLMIFDCMAIFLTGVIGTSGVIRGLIENKISKKNAVIYAIFQFIFCIDVISSVIIYKKIKNNKCEYIEKQKTCT